MTKRKIAPKTVASFDIMDAAEAAAYLRTSTSTLAKYRMYGCPGRPSSGNQRERRFIAKPISTLGSRLALPPNLNLLPHNAPAFLASRIV